jgi:predicted 2-oxoglutarate/Fe(II)-dependent dioxygenase YbiX
MPTANFFRKLGFYVDEGFLSRDLCGQLRTHMRAGVPSAGTVGTDGAEFVVDREVRRVTQLKLNDTSTALIKTRLIDIKAVLERHFHLTLADCQTPQFLHYIRGDFYQPHRDGGVLAGSSSSKSRRISAVIFLNNTSPEPREGTYGGGELTFYEQFDDPVGRTLGFPLEADEGLFVAFRADALHSVAPVTHGDRYTIASWYV